MKRAPSFHQQFFPFVAPGIDVARIGNLEIIILQFDVTLYIAWLIFVDM